METVIEACRLCAKLYANPKELEFVHLFEPYKGLEHVVQFILQQLQIWQIDVNVGDGLPLRICASCFDRFCDMDVFRQECLQAQHTLVQYYIDINENQGQINILNNNNCNNGQIAALDNSKQIDHSNESSSSSSFHLSMPSAGDNNILPQQNLGMFPNTINESSNPNGVNLHLPVIPTPNDSNDLAMDTMDLLTNLSSNDMFLNHPIGLDEIESVIKADIQNEADEEDLEKILQSNVIKKTVKESVPYENNNNSLIAPNGMKAKVKYKNEKLQSHNQLPPEQVIQTNIVEEDILNENEDETELENSPKCIQSGIPLACQYCYCHGRDFVDNLIYPNDEALSQHYFDIHDPNLPYNCPFCVETFKAPKQRDYHVQKQHYSLLPATECEYCHKKISTTIEIHQFTCPFVGNWHCKVCNEKFPNTALSRFRAHQRNHDASKQYKCRVCNRDFVRRANLEAHERTHQLDHVLMIRCNNCGESFSCDYDLKRHKYLLHGGEMPVKCDDCQKGFASLAFLNRHNMNFHSDKANNNTKDSGKTCKNCGAVFLTLQRLRAHLQRPRDENGRCKPLPGMKTEINENPSLGNTVNEKKTQKNNGLFPCKECPKRFYLKSQLEKHLNTHDACLRPHLCTDCNVRCRSKYELQEHINVTHLSLKPFQCKTCGKRFGYKKDLNIHQLFHTDLNIKCKEIDCNFVCKNDKSLNDHMRLKHRPILCDYCGISLTRQKLLAHMRLVHSDQINEEIAELHSISQQQHRGTRDGTLNKLQMSKSNAQVVGEVITQNTTNLDLIANPGTDPNQYFVDSLMDLDEEIIIK